MIHFLRLDIFEYYNTVQVRLITCIFPKEFSLYGTGYLILIHIRHSVVIQFSTYGTLYHTYFWTTEMRKRVTKRLTCITYRRLSRLLGVEWYRWFIANRLTCVTYVLQTAGTAGKEHLQYEYRRVLLYGRLVAACAVALAVGWRRVPQATSVSRYCRSDAGSVHSML